MLRRWERCFSSNGQDTVEIHDYGCLELSSAPGVDALLNVKSGKFIRDPEGNLISMRTSAGSFYYTTDALGSIILLTDRRTTTIPGNQRCHQDAAVGNPTATPGQYAGGYYEASTNRIKMGAHCYTLTA